MFDNGTYVILHRVFTPEHVCKRKHKQKEKPVRCSLCGKPLDIIDRNQNFTIHRRLGYGTKYDGDALTLRFCCSCMEAIIDNCAVSPVRSFDT